MHWSQRGPITPGLQLEREGGGKRERERREGRAGVKKERRERQGKELKQQKDLVLIGTSYNTLFLITGNISNIEYG